MTTVSVRRRRPGDHRAAGRPLVVASVVLGFAAIRAFTVGVGAARFGDGVVAHDLSIASAWLINLAVAEWAVRRRPGPRRRPQPSLAGAQP